jgi:uncharacterized protein YigA (DUF484 family)
METVNQVETEARTFTQEELNKIVEDRLQRERQKYSDYDAMKERVAALGEEAEAGKKALERADALQAQLDAMNAANAERELRERIASETGVPASLLRGSAEEDLRSQAAAILGFAKASRPTYPNVKDGGEATPPQISKQDILGIKNEKERLKAIRENIDLFK